MVAEADVIGICGLDKSEPAVFFPELEELATALVVRAAVVIQNAQLFTQVSEALRRLRSLSQRRVEVQGAERRYMARELHDEPDQALTALAVGLQLLRLKAHRPEAVLAGVNELSCTVETV